MLEKKMYSIKEASEICNIPSKTLRYYDKLGLLESKRNEYNNYRVYSNEELLLIPLIKYYKQMGFTLKSIRKLINKDNSGCDTIKNIFLDKINHIKVEIEELKKQEQFSSDWYNLIVEAEEARKKNIDNVSVKWISPVSMLYKKQIFTNDMKAAIINIEWMNYLSEINHEISGEITLQFSSIKDRLNNKEQEAAILQRHIFSSSETKPSETSKP